MLGNTAAVTGPASDMVFGVGELSHRAAFAQMTIEQQGFCVAAIAGKHFLAVFKSHQSHNAGVTMSALHPLTPKNLFYQWWLSAPLKVSRQQGDQ